MHYVRRSRALTRCTISSCLRCCPALKAASAQNIMGKWRNATAVTAGRSRLQECISAARLSRRQPDAYEALRWIQLELYPIWLNPSRPSCAPPVPLATPAKQAAALSLSCKAVACPACAERIAEEVAGTTALPPTTSAVNGSTRGLLEVLRTSATHATSTPRPSASCTVGHSARIWRVRLMGQASQGIA